jgi:excisionase family DNA binding protein
VGEWVAKQIGEVGAEVHTVDEVADRLRIGRNQAYEAVRRGDIPSIRIGNSYRIPKTAIDRMLSPAE